MRFILASLSLGLFTWLSYVVFTNKFADGIGASSKAQFLSTIVTRLSDDIGTGYTALALLGLGAFFSFAIIAFGPREDA